MVLPVNTATTAQSV